ncbi:hypothetical protein CLOP_g18389, partial [Closterium sp. NIES-67]
YIREEFIPGCNLH